MGVISQGAGFLSTAEKYAEESDASSTHFPAVIHITSLTFTHLLAHLKTYIQRLWGSGQWAEKCREHMN